MIFENVQKLMIPEGEVVKISHGTTVLWERPGLPLAYQRVEYIQTDGNQYIDTGVLASDYTDRITYDLKMARMGYTDGNYHNYFFGCLNNSKRSGNVCVLNSRGALVFYLGKNGSGITIGDVPETNAVFTLKITFSAPSKEITGVYNGNNVTSSNSRNSDMPSANIWLFACNLNGSPTSSTSTPCVAKLYNFSMTQEDGTPIRNFVPCYRKSDGVIGLYDTVGSTFYTNKGTGSFTKGADV